ncbi:N-acetylmannosamine-6-phosphate 2-epimerase [Anaerosalibacter sp. Marseille-P3206]|uniref:N-acetylmannosamine-6-phosphate 2-epimerase n=1 Tax=Anaerosalibacter sp. Marseille-P3206 TaxID=1871005 RepID=UPI000985E127|nr:N-acetylmannosamine-6-phosphate 2-epimerase [Anaerosalibacter sp. Marseille-P3206]
MVTKDVLKLIKGGLVVSCQALQNEPLHSSYIMSRMAYAAMLGGAVGIRANGGEDIVEIKKTVNLPIIGLRKRVYDNFDVFITPTMVEVKEVVEAGADIVAIDATDRKRPDGLTLKEFVEEIRKTYPNILIMGDISKVSEGIECEKLGFDLVGTTLSGYTEDTKNRKLPDFELMKTLVEKLTIPVLAEGGIGSPDELKEAMDCGIYAAVVGTAITRPMEVTKKFVSAIS